MSSGGAAQRGRRGHEPQRRCVICGRAGAKRGMVRLVRTGEGRVQVDPTGKRSGRGAYICLGVGEGCEAGGCAAPDGGGGEPADRAQPAGDPRCRGPAGAGAGPGGGMRAEGVAWGRE